MIFGNIFNTYDWVDAWQRGMAAPSIRFAIASRLLDDRVFLPPPAAFLTQFEPLLQARRASAATFLLLERLSRPHLKPAFNIETVETEQGAQKVEESVMSEEGFCRLLRFTLAERAEAPSTLLIAPMAGHYATLLRDTVRGLLPHSDVYVTDWANARDVPMSVGGFDLNDYIDQVIAYLERLGPSLHVVGVCQAGAPLVAAIALMESDPALAEKLPRSIAIMGSPIDVSRSPTQVNTLAQRHTVEWFTESFISIVPAGHPGANRAVYPGYLQLTAFLAMNPERHEKSLLDAIRHFSEGDFTTSEKIDSFYGEFFSTMDLTAEFYLQTVAQIFRNNQLADGSFVSRGRPVELQRIRRTPIMAIEAERDDVTGLGQTRAILELTPALAEEKKRYYLLENAGHYGLFSGSRFREDIVPVLREFQANAT